jgi:RNA polymerase sigma factor (sigma-70 family)
MSRSEENIELIVLGCQKGDPESQKKLFKLYFQLMKVIAMRYTNSEDDAKDLTQEAFIQVFTKINSYTGSGSIEGWIKRIVINKSINFFKYKKKLPLSVTNEEWDRLEYIDESSNDREDHLGMIYEADLTYDEILGCIQQMKYEFRIVFIMYVIDGLSHKEIAEHLTIKEELSRIRLKRGRESLQKLLMEYVGNRKKILS